MGQWIRDGQLRRKGMRHVSPSASSRARRRGGGARIVASCGRPRESVVASSRDTARAFCATCRNGMPLLLRHILRHVSFQRPFLLRHVPHMPRDASPKRKPRHAAGSRASRAPTQAADAARGTPRRTPTSYARSRARRSTTAPRVAVSRTSTAPAQCGPTQRASREGQRDIARKEERALAGESCVVVANTRRRSRSAALGPTLLLRRPRTSPLFATTCHPMIARLERELPCHVHVMSCHVMSCHAIPCHVI